MGLFTRKSPSLIGLDISAATVKLVELSHVAQRYRVEACAVESLPPNAIVAHNISDAKAVGETIRRAVAQSGSKTRNAAVAVAGSVAVAKTLAMDASLTDAELETEIVLEADRSLPFPIDEVAMDFESMNLSVADPAQVDVLLAACRLEHVASLEAAVALGGLKAVVVDMDAYCLHRAVDLLLPDATGGTLGLVEIGTGSVALLVCEGHGVSFHREEPFDGGLPSANSPNDSEALHSSSLGVQTSVADRQVEELLAALSRLLRLYASAQRQRDAPTAAIETPFDTGLQRLLLSGEGASGADLAAIATQRLGIAAEVVDPLANADIAPRVESELLRCQAPRFTKACGLALRAFDHHDPRGHRWCM